MSAFRLPMYGVFLLILAACAGASGKWTKAGVGEQVMATDLDQCEFVGLASGLAATKQQDNTYTGISASGQMTTTQLPGAGALSYAEQSDAFARCMKARGYTRTVAP